ncbi:MAG: DUF2961 domain-containing protein [Bacteroidetes bacterium]|nr:DUF2961 domain-containing protein [Bacteroidota bacterium]
MRRRITFTALFLVGLCCGVYAQQSLENLLSPANLPQLKEGRLLQLSSGDTTGGNSDFVAIRPGETAVIADIRGPGVIVGMWFTIMSSDKHFLRRILLRAYWDDEKLPSVEVPVGDFFGTGFAYKHYLTPFLGMSSGGYYCYFPMPFAKAARLEIVNETGQEVQSFYYHINYRQLTQPPAPDIAYFHASWRREPRTAPGKPYLILDARGRGHLVGVNMNMQGYDNGMQYLEGDELVYVDGEKIPSLRGTGTEDYFKGGWYFNKGEFAAPYHGLILKDDTLDRIAAYRFHIPDAVSFNSSLKFTIEHGDQNAEIADYSSTAYWYQLEPHAPFPPMLPPGARIPLRVVVPGRGIEAEDMVPQDPGLMTTIEDMTPFGAEWSGMKQLKIDFARAGDGRELSFRVEEEAYDIAMYVTQGPGYGRIRVSQSGRPIATYDGYAQEILPGGKVLLKDVKAVDGLVRLEVNAEGKHDRATGFAAGIDALILEPHRSFIPEWQLIGPFDNPRDQNLRRLGLDAVYPPEKEIDFTKTYPGVDKQPVQWTLTKTPPKGRIDLYQFDPYEMVVVYAHTYVYSPKDQTLPFLLGTDDGVKVFLNGKPIHEVLAVRVVRVDQDRIPLALKKGWNSLLLKIENNYGGYNFYARILDPGHTIRFNALRPE